MSLDRISLSAAVRTLAALAVVGLVAVVLLTWLPMRSVQVNGALYREISASDALVADVKPPPLYPYRAYALVLDLANETGTARERELVEQLRAQRPGFEQAATVRLAVEPDPEIRAALEKTIAAGRSFYDACDAMLAASAHGDAGLKVAALDRAREAFGTAGSASDALVKLSSARAARLEEEAARRSSQVLWSVVTAVLLVLAALGAAAVAIARQVRRAIAGLGGETGRLRAAVDAGRLSDRADAGAVHPDFRGVVEVLNGTMDAYARPLAVSGEALGAIAKGEIPPTITDAWAGDFERMKASLNAVSDMMQRRKVALDALVAAAAEGRLGHRADASGFVGANRRLLDGMNQLLDRVVQPLQATARAVDAIARGEIPPPIETPWQGEFEVLRRNLNTCIASVRALVEDADGLTRSAQAGALSARADATRHQGDFRRIVAGMNGTLDAVVKPLEAAAGCVARIASGEIPPAIAEPWPGEFATLRDHLNTCITAVNALVTDAEGLVSAAVAGDVSRRADAGRHQGDFRRVVDGMNATLDAVTAPVTEARGVLERLARRDLRARMTGRFQGDHARLAQAVDTTAEALHEALVQVQGAVEQVSSAAAQIASSSQAVASGASEQAASLQETTGVIAAVTETTHQSAGRAQQASRLADTARAAAGQGTAAVERLQGTMTRIRTAAEGTGAIIRDVSDIAFQTNLLALNAAVEAARAGDAGRGFAVVAEEVRSLALRAKEAAGRTEALIKQSVAETGEGEQAAKEVSARLADIAQAVVQVNDTVGEIAEAGKAQANGIAQVNRSVAEMDRVTQQNAASAEESSSAASELSSQAEHLAKLVGEFELDEGGPAPSGRHVPRALGSRVGAV